ncbi:DgyrCDS2197 [Dimorphilus gyrociliatus]|uniref:DgyrCDS2197 n=1 Tax=Dimorphilus gyrociliatus TaxID=2664684 RepID=A0A7I8VCB7_9ANNE|nr:DgyrCDS2197 [Dimorphilus gyrociliatus]
MPLKVGRSSTLPVYSRENTKRSKKTPRRENTKIALEIGGKLPELPPPPPPTGLSTIGPRTVYDGVPLRYEHSRIPFGIKDATHKDIVDLGKSLTEKMTAEEEESRENAVRAAEEAVWAEAETIRIRAVEKAIESTKAEYEKLLKKVEKLQSSKVREAVARAEARIEEAISDAVQEEKVNGERRLKEAVAEADKRWLADLKKAVLKAREEERQAAVQKAEIAAKAAEENTKKLLEEAEKNKLIELKNLEEEYLYQLQATDTSVRVQEEAVAEIRLKCLKEEMDRKLVGLKEILDKERQLSEETKIEIERVKDSKKRVEKELKNVYTSFHSFVENSRPYNIGQSAFVIPKLHTIDYAIDNTHNNILQRSLLKTPSLTDSSMTNVN